MKRVLVVLLLVGTVFIATGAVQSDFSLASQYFSKTNLTINNWAKPAVNVWSDNPFGTVFLSEDGSQLGIFTTGEVAADLGYDGAQGALDAFNDFRGCARKTRQPAVELEGVVALPADSLLTSIPADMVTHANEVVGLVNGERAALGVPELTVDADLMELAMTRARELSSSYGHVRPDGTRVSQTYRCAENIARGPLTASGTVTAWMASDSHKENMVSGRYTSTGVGCFVNGNGTCYWVQVFK